MSTMASFAGMLTAQSVVAPDGARGTHTFRVGTNERIGVEVFVPGTQTNPAAFVLRREDSASFAGEDADVAEILMGHVLTAGGCSWYGEIDGARMTADGVACAGDYQLVCTGADGSNASLVHIVLSNLSRG